MFCDVEVFLEIFGIVKKAAMFSDLLLNLYKSVTLQGRMGGGGGAILNFFTQEWRVCDLQI